MKSIGSATTVTTSFDREFEGSHGIDDPLIQLTFDCKEDLDYAKSYLQLLQAKQMILDNCSIKVGMQKQTIKPNGQRKIHEKTFAIIWETKREISKSRQLPKSPLTAPADDHEFQDQAYKVYKSTLKKIRKQIMRGDRRRDGLWAQ